MFIKHHNSCVLTSGQKSIFFIQNLEGAARYAYNEPLVYTLKGYLSLETLQKTIDTLMQKHPMLRAYFKQDEDGNVFQSIEQNAYSKINFIEGAERDISPLIFEEIVRPFNLNNAPLMRVSVIRITPIEHILIMVFHHLIIDGTSLTILLKEFNAYYNQIAREETIIEPSSPTSDYMNYSQNQQQHVLSQDYKNKVTDIATALRGYNELNFLPSSTYPLSTDPFLGDRVYFKIDSDLYKKIKEQAKSSKVTPFHILITAYAIFIGKYTRSQEVIIGVPFANRTSDLERTHVGYYVNTIPIRVSLVSQYIFSKVLSDIKKLIFSHLTKQEVSFEDIAEHLDLVRKEPGRHPLIQTLLNWSVQVNAMNLHNLETQLQHHYFSKTAKFDLSLFMLEETDASITGYFEYRTSLFDQAIVQQFTVGFKTLLQQIVAHPDQAISTFRLLDAQEEQHMARLFFSPSLISKKQEDKLIGSLIDIFNHIAQQYATHLALVFGSEQYTYQEVLNQADHWARYIRARYKKVYGQAMIAGTLIALCLPRHPDMIFAILGTLKAGGAYVPVDPSFPEERIDYILKDSKASLIISHLRSYPSNLNLPLDQVIYMDDTSLQEDDIENSEALPAIMPQNPAYVIYTSGSTGQPKGVLITHGNVLSLFRSVKKKANFSYQDVWPLFHTYCFDVSVWEIWGAFIFGGKLVIVPHDTTRDPEKFCQLLREEKVSILTQTPTAFQMLVNQDSLSSQKLALRFVFFAGESLNVSMLNPWVSKYGIHKPMLVNMYGATEATIHTTYKVIEQEVIEKGRDNIGKALEEFRLCIMDNNMQWCPIGFVGEICIGGAGLSQGYLNRKALTEEKFINDPYIDILSLNPGEKIYRTGDLGRWMPDGSIEYLGRKDFQVKLRGFRIELGEIESALGRFPHITQTLLLLKGEGENAYLSAYYTVKIGQHVNSSNLLKHLKSLLPDYMVPQRLTQLEHFPITNNGKIDRRKVHQYNDNPPEANIQLPLVTEIQHKVASIWAEVLRIDLNIIHLNSNFFTLGGNSLLVVKMLSLIKNRLNQELSISRFMAEPTIASLADHKSVENINVSRVFLEQLKTKANLCSSIQPLSDISPHLSNPKVILLTGATGFLGIHILAELLKKSSIYKIYCLVRGNSLTQATQYLKQKLLKYNIDLAEEDKKKIIVVLGDLEQKQLGLSETDFMNLAKEVDAIFHVGAQVNHILDFNTLYASNVQSTFEILRLATFIKNKAVHFVSTLAAGLLETFAQQNLELGFLSSGYITTKFASEHLLYSAFQRGISAHVYRPGNIITGENGLCEPENNTTLLRLKGMLQLGKAYIEEHESLEMMPVDVLACAIVSLAREKSRFSYNLNNDQSLSWRDYLMIAEEQGFTFKWINKKEEWEDILAKLDPTNALYSVSMFYRERLHHGPLIKPDYNISTPSYTQMVHRQLQGLVSMGFLTPEQKLAG